MSKKVTLKQCMGIDVSMKKIDCCLAFYTEDLKIKVVATSGHENNPDGFVKLREWLNRKQDNSLALHVNMEATGTYHEEAAYFLAGVGYRLSVIQPTKGKQYGVLLLKLKIFNAK